MKKAPAFQFYVRDFLTDESVVLMSLAARGAYVQLLCHQWLEGSIPADLALLARLCHTGEAEMTRVWGEVSPCFAETADGRLVNERLEEQRQEREAWVEKCRRGGRASGESRRQAADTETKGSSTTPEQPLQAPTTTTQDDGTDDHIGNKVNDRWRHLGLTVPRTYDWLLGAAKVSSLTQHYTEPEILALVDKVARLPDLHWVGSRGPSYLCETAKGRLIAEVVETWNEDRNEPGGSDGPTGDFEFPEVAAIMEGKS